MSPPLILRASNCMQLESPMYGMPKADLIDAFSLTRERVQEAGLQTMYQTCVIRLCTNAFGVS